MLSSIKSFLNWPTKGISNLSDLTNYFKANWMSLVILLIVGLIILWVLKKVFGFIFGLFRE